MWGLGEGIEFDVTEPPKRLDSVMIQAGDIIDSFGFSYTDQAGKKHTVGPSGGRGGSLTTVRKLCKQHVCRKNFTYINMFVLSC